MCGLVVYVCEVVTQNYLHDWDKKKFWHVAQGLLKDIDLIFSCFTRVGVGMMWLMKQAEGKSAIQVPFLHILSMPLMNDMSKWYMKERLAIKKATRKCVAVYT